jgi:hypothetical protein
LDRPLCPQAPGGKTVFFAPHPPPLYSILCSGRENAHCLFFTYPLLAEKAPNEELGSLSMKRELEIDVARGLMLVCMTLTHLPTALTPWVNQPFGYFSASEGFIFLSALFTGRIYYRLLTRDGLQAREIVVTHASAVRVPRATTFPGFWDCCTLCVRQPRAGFI